MPPGDSDLANGDNRLNGNNGSNTDNGSLHPRRTRKTISPETFASLTGWAVWILVLTIVSGAAVRLTGSGLGCPDWPSCTAGDIVAPLRFHAWVEFANRLVSGTVTIASTGALVAAMRRSPRRRDLTALSAGLVVGLAAEVVLGGVVVYYKLAPLLVTAHFLLGLLFLADAVVLHHRACLPDAHLEIPNPDRLRANMSRALVACAALAVTMGTVVTSTGPHGGAPSAPRFDFSLHAVAQLHGSSAELFLAVVVLNLILLTRRPAPERVMRKAQWLLAVVVAQGVIGYTQYFSGDPAWMVGFHVTGAALVVVTVLRYHLEVRSVPVERTRPASPTVHAVGVG